MERGVGFSRRSNLAGGKSSEPGVSFWPFENGSTPLFWGMTPFIKGHGDFRWIHTKKKRRFTETFVKPLVSQGSELSGSPKKVETLSVALPQLETMGRKPQESQKQAPPTLLFWWGMLIRCFSGRALLSFKANGGPNSVTMRHLSTIDLFTRTPWFHFCFARTPGFHFCFARTWFHFKRVRIRPYVPHVIYTYIYIYICII